jgi:hypothetical protein
LSANAPLPNRQFFIPTLFPQFSMSKKDRIPLTVIARVRKRKTLSKQTEKDQTLIANRIHQNPPGVDSYNATIRNPFWTTFAEKGPPGCCAPNHLYGGNISGSACEAFQGLFALLVL